LLRYALDHASSAACRSAIEVDGPSSLTGRRRGRRSDPEFRER
jgi:hypothetical protein